MTCPFSPTYLSVCTFARAPRCVARMRPALCGPHSRPHARLRWRSRLRLRMSGLLARAWERAVPSADAEPTNHQPTGSTDQSRGIWRPAGLPGRAARPDLAPGRRGLCPSSQYVRCGRPRACLPLLPDSLQPFPPVSPERGGAFCLPGPANRLSFAEPRDSFAKPRGSPTRDPARAGATVGRCLPAVRAYQVWGLGVQHRHRSLDDCPPFSLEIWGSCKRRFFSRFRVHPASSGPSEQAVKALG
jgi:hypothetical protein